MLHLCSLADHRLLAIGHAKLSRVHARGTPERTLHVAAARRGRAAKGRPSGVWVAWTGPHVLCSRALGHCLARLVSRSELGHCSH
jgi:hypothetical protein